MKIDFDSPVRDLNGAPFKDGEANLTLASVCAAALLQTYPDESASITGEEKYQRYDLATRTKGTSDMSFEDVKRLKLLIGKFFSTSVVGPAYDLLDGRDRFAATPAPAPAPIAAAPAPKTPRRKKALEAVPAVVDAPAIAETATQQ